ncbi:phosphatidylserine decarboxylase [Candidatus Riesia pediculicola USDA]|uniref:phosphatidylserine decarboxylase n=2 Tax=Candidatus Riesia pediculicola TaxID=401619 RepID=D4G847_RIEPU|nr:phosphatidylserine decarboxylase [Candidatus Riesia pediculicola USDA]ARC53752.1 hypothetical protein AOE55_01120 [Candidatus Riesia pediculicola]
MVKIYFFLLKRVFIKIINFFSNRRIPYITRLMILFFIKLYKIDLRDLKYKNLSHYKTFNDFFARKLNDDARKIGKNDLHLSSPSDGTISALGTILQRSNHCQMICVKKKLYDLKLLILQDKYLKESCSYGSFITIYLSPGEYHRVHTISKCLLKKLIYVPGELFSVNPKRSSEIFDVFIKNERMIFFFETDFGKVLLILVGSILVGGIETRWNGELQKSENNSVWTFENQSIFLKKGEEIGYFKLGGSTVICIFEKNKFVLNQYLKEGLKLKMGDLLAYVKK